MAHKNVFGLPYCLPRREWMLKLFEEEAEKSIKHKNYKFWQVGKHAIEIYGPKFTWEKINYMHNNPKQVL